MTAYGQEGRLLGGSERTALQELVHEHLQGLYALAWQLAGPDAEDLVQEALVRACGSIAQLRDQRAGGRWLRVILTNVWRDRVRRDVHEPDELFVENDEDFSLYGTLVDEDPLPYSDTLHIDFLGAFSEDDIHLVLQRLPTIYRTTLVLRYIAGFDSGEVAQMLELPLGTVLSQLHRGRQRFEKEMWRYAEESGVLVGAATTARRASDATSDATSDTASDTGAPGEDR